MWEGIHWQRHGVLAVRFVELLLSPVHEDCVVDPDSDAGSADAIGIASKPGRQPTASDFAS
jgi:hypothetical protein